MAINTLKSPGVQITERDLSQYTEAIAGTAVLVTGFASKGRDYEPILLTSRSAWLQQFGEPSNEAERYFFNASMEVINQGGTLYACKLPYKNDALNKFVGKTYTVDVSDAYPKSISSVVEYINSIPGFKEVIAGDYTNFLEKTETDDATKYSLWHASDVKNDLDRFIGSVKQSVVLIPYAYALSNWMGPIDIENTEKDNWMWTPVQYIYAKMSAMFDSRSYLNGDNGIKHVATLSALSGFFVKESGVPLTPEELEFNLSSLHPDNNSTDAYISAFLESILTAFGGDPAHPEITENNPSFKVACDPSSGVILSSVVNSFPEFAECDAYKFFQDNKYLFDALNNIDFNQDKDLLKGQKPYMYCDDKHFNVGAYYRAFKEYNKVKEAQVVYNEENIAKTMNATLDLVDALESLSADRLAGYFAKPIEIITKAVSPTLSGRYDEEDDEINDDLKEALLNKGKYDLLSPLEMLEDAFEKLFADPEFKEIVEKSKQGKWQDTPFTKFAIQYYMDNTLIPNADIQKALRDAENLNVFYEQFDPDGEGEKVSATVFDLFNYPESNSPELSSIDAVIDGAVNTMRYDQMLDYSVKFTTKEPYLSVYTDTLSAYAETTPEGSNQRQIVNAMKVSSVVEALAYSEIKRVDPTVDKYLKIDSEASNVQLFDLETIDGFATGEVPVSPNKIVIVDKTRGTLGRAYAKSENGVQKQIVGIIPVITTAANALYAQALLETGDSAISRYNAIKTAETLQDLPKYLPFTIDNADAAVPFDSDNAEIYTVSQMVAASFPSISFTDDGTIDRQNLKKIGVVVLRAFLDPGEGNKVNYDIVEAYAGELDKNAVDPNTGATTFIDTLINTQSEYIEFYSNCFNQTATRKKYEEADLFVIPPQKAGVLGFYEEMTKKNISLTDSILKALPLVWEKNEDINEKQIDIVCDAGVSNIAQFIKSCFAGRAGEYDPASEYASLFKLRSKEDTKTWRDVLAMYDNFCKNIRKDCMFVADGPRPFCLTGNKKIVRPSKPSNTVDGNILPMLKYITGVNTNYGAGYCDWFEKADEFSGDYFWCPPSIQAMGVYLNTDINHDFWMAPAGLNRGVVAALDVAFNPTMRQSNEIYPKCWNYARSYPNDGIVLEGQRTFQTASTALDRINVRRTMLRLERMTYEIARWFVYEDNTVLTRQRLYDALDGVFKEIQGQGGIQRYKIICDETINTPEVIDRSELRVKIGIVPTKSAEFIICEFNVLRQGGSWTEML